MIQYRDLTLKVMDKVKEFKVIQIANSSSNPNNEDLELERKLA